MKATIETTSPSYNKKLLAPVHRLVWMLYLIGLWPTITHNRDDKQQSWWCWLAYTFYTVAFQSIFTFAYVGFKCINFWFITDLTIITRAMFITLTELSLAIKIVNFYARMDTIQSCLKTVRAIRLHSADEEKLFLRHLSLLQKILFGFLFTANTTGILSYLSPVLVGGTILPYPGWYPLDWQNITRDYWIVFVYQVLGMIFQIQALVIVEVFFIYLMVVVSAQLDILANRIGRIGYVSQDEEKNQYTNDSYQNTVDANLLKDCIRVHCNVLNISRQIERTGSIPYFIQFLLSCIILCVAVFQIGIMTIRGSMAEFGFYLGFVLTMLTQIFLPCYFGNEIQLKSERLLGSLYFSNWPGRSQQFGNLVLVTMELLRRPRKLVVGQLFSLTLDSFLKVLNKAYSLYAVLKSFNE